MGVNPDLSADGKVNVTEACSPNAAADHLTPEAVLCNGVKGTP